MNQSYCDALACASILPVTGINQNMFLRNLPNKEMRLASMQLLKDRILRVDGGKIEFVLDSVNLTGLSEHENLTAVVAFLEGLLKEMTSCPKVEDSREYVSVLHAFLNAGERFCGVSKDIDDKLAELLASLVDLMDEPLFHFITKEMKCDRKEHLSVLCNAEEALALKVLERAYEASETSKQFKLFRFAYASLQSISHAHHNWIGVNDSTEYVDNLIDLIGRRITNLKYIISLEETLAELERECGLLPEED